MRDKQASILVLSIWVLVLFTILGTAIYKIFSTQVNLAKFIEQRVLAQFIAWAAIKDAQEEIASSQTNIGSLKELGKIRTKKLGSIEFSYTLACLLYTSPSPRDRQKSRMPSSA